MATCPRCLCFVLTVWMAALRPSAAVRVKSPDSAWWGTKEAALLLQSARNQITAGHFAAAENVFEQGVHQAEARHDPIAEIRCLSGVAGTRLARFDYRGALAIYNHARALAQASRDFLDLGAIDFNLSGIFQQVLDFDSARHSAQEGLEAARQAPGAYYAPQLYLEAGQLAAAEGDPGAPFYQAAIEAARQRNAVGVEAQAWDLLARERLDRKDLAGAEKAEARAFLLRRLFLPRDLGLSYFLLADLKLAQAGAAPSGSDRGHLLKNAAGFSARAMQEYTRGNLDLPPYLPWQQRGRIRLARGQTPQALKDLEKSVELARRWEMGVPPALSWLDGANAQIEQSVFEDFIEAAAGYAARTQNAHWREASFRGVQFSRAAGSEEKRALAEIWRRKLPPEFWDVLGRLKAENTRLLRSGEPDSDLSTRLRLKITEMEAEAGIGFYPNAPENFLGDSSLSHLKLGLGNSGILLSFVLGGSRSFLWALTADGLDLYKLPPGNAIRRAIKDFRNAIEEGQPEAEIDGKQLYQMLFGQLKPRERERPDWFVSVDDALLELPFAALVRGDGYLVEAHTLRIVSGYSSGPKATAKAPGGDGRFVGMGDPIYNIADPRWAGGMSKATRFHFWPKTTLASDKPLQFNRLPGSGREVETSARIWSQWGKAQVLEGREARRQRLLELLSPAPSAIHFATHIAKLPGSRNEASIVLGLGPRGEPELLTPSDIAMLRVPGSVVVMTGCDSAAGDDRPGVGLAGLTRAWLLAGARSVVATEWPVRDSSGGILANFYKNLRDFPAAEALRRSQIEAIRAGTAEPAAWASFQVFEDSGN